MIEVLKEFRWRIQGSLIAMSVDLQGSLAEETEAVAKMAVYWPFTIFAAVKAVKQVGESF